VNCWERGKSSGRHSLTSTVKRGFDRVFDQGLTTGVYRLGQGFHRGSLARFSGDDPGWPRFDRGLTGLTRLIRSLALMTVIKNLGRHRSAASCSLWWYVVETLGHVMVLLLTFTLWHCFWYSLSHYVCVIWSWRTCNLCIRVCLQIRVWQVFARLQAWILF
jgi:hypothetical protein